MARLKSGPHFTHCRHHAAILAVVTTMAANAIVSMPTVAATQISFATPEQAVDTLVSTARTGSIKELLKILGPGSKDLISSGDPVADAQARTKFVTEYEDTHNIKQESDARFILIVGKDDWPFPFPIVKERGGWRFDASAGASEILDRRIGNNELSAIQVCHAYVAAQREYATLDRNHSGFLEYAQKFVSSPGRHNGLYWPPAADGEESPLGPLMASARAEGYGAGEGKRSRKPYHGYYYRILKGQGPAARDGAYNYVVKGHMIAGFALVAFPAEYGVSGVMTFIVNHDGVVYQKDLGPRTEELARKMRLFNPDSSWKTPS